MCNAQIVSLGHNRKKGKKEGKKAKKESVLKDAIANAKLWETKLETLEKSRQEYRLVKFKLHVL